MSYGWDPLCIDCIYDGIEPPKPAVTLVRGMALCRIHANDFCQRTKDAELTRDLERSKRTEQSAREPFDAQIPGVDA